MADQRGRRFKEMHEQGTFVLLNAWDGASAKIIATAGAQALATTSSGISWSRGVPDGEHLQREEVIAATARIVSAVELPVTADVESGYGPSPGDVAATLGGVCEAGAVGANLEDRPGPGGQVLRSIDEQCARLASAREAADGFGASFVLNARTDVFLAAVGEPDEREEQVMERGRAYREAGADCLFVPGLIELDVIQRLATDLPLPLNVLLAPGRGPSIDELGEAGVRRISVGHGLASTAYAAVRRATEQLLAGRDEALRDGIAPREMQQLMARSIGAAP